MAQNTASIRKYHRAKRRKQKKRKKTIMIAALVSGLALIAISAFWIFNQNTESVSFEYSPEDINYDQPVVAIHEMEPSNLASIPFLPKEGPQPQIILPETFFNFGNVGATEIVRQEFVIANTGEAPLTISRAYTTCGCTTAEFTSTVIPPGQVSIMTLIFDAGYHDARGQTVRRGVIIENNDPKSSQMEIWTQAKVSNS